MPTDLKWIERARRIGWEGTAMLRWFHVSDLPQSVQQAIAAELATVAAEVRAEKDAEWKGLMDDQVAVTEDLRAQLAQAHKQLEATGGIAACMRLNEKLRAQLAACVEALKPFALAWQTWYANPRGPSAQNQVTNDQFLQAAKLLRDSHMTDLAALAAEAERGREEGGAA